MATSLDGVVNVGVAGNTESGVTGLQAERVVDSIADRHRRYRTALEILIFCFLVI
jgi:hypothetical protein